MRSALRSAVETRKSMSAGGMDWRPNPWSFAEEKLLALQLTKTLENHECRGFELAPKPLEFRQGETSMATLSQSRNT